MKRSIAALLVLIVGLFWFGAPTALAQSPPASDNPLQPLGWLVGGKWLAEIKTPDGQPLTVEATYEWAAHQRSLKYSIVFLTADQKIPQYDGLYWWNPADKQISLLQVDRQGNVTQAVLTIEGDTLRQQNKVLRADGTRHQQRVEIVHEDPNLFAFKALVPKGDDWVEAVSFEYRRTREKPDDE